MPPKTRASSNTPDFDYLFASSLRDRKIIVVSNRGPVEYRRQHGHLTVHRGSGGLVTALSALGRFIPFTWVASALSDGDREARRQAQPLPVQASVHGHDWHVRFVTHDADAYQKYYNVISNPFLWFLQHYMWDLTYDLVDHHMYEAWENGYEPVNRTFATATIHEAQGKTPSPLVMIHDYQLYLVGGWVRQAVPAALLQHFVHIPWPAPRYWALLPPHMRLAILESLCACDIVGFQTHRDAENFVATCQDLLPGAEVDLVAMTVAFRGHTVQAQHYPVSVDVHDLKTVATSSRVQEYERTLRGLAAEQCIVRVDRMDPTKNVLRGFLAYETLLHRYADLRGKVTFLAFLVPSRTQIVQYQKYAATVFDTARRINAAFGTGDWEPIKVFYEENYMQAIAGMRLADVLLVNPIVDGMNLVAKEGPIVNAKSGVLVLSETVGAYEQLRHAVLPVSPADVEGTVRTLHQALHMDRQERVRRIVGLRRAIEAEDITHWLYRQLDDIGAVASA